MDVLLNQLFESVTNGIRVISLDGTTLRVNTAFSKMVGRSKEEVLSEKCYETFKGLYCGTDDCSLNRIIKGEGFIEEEVAKELPDGTVIPCILTISPLCDATGRIIGIIEDFRDISRLKKSQQALQESEEKFRSYIDKAPDGIFIVDSTGRYIDANPAGCEALGYQKEELLGKRVYELASADFGHFTTLQQEGLCRGEVMVSRKDGSKLVFDQLSVALDNGNYIGYKRDITKRKQIENELRESERYHNLILNGISDIVVLYKVESESDFRVVKANKSCLDLLGFKEEQIVGKLIQEVMPPQVAARLIENDRKAIRRGLPHQSEESFPFANLEINYIPVIDENENCKYLVVTAREISEKKKLEEHLLKIEKLESVGLLAGGIAHDFNNILTAISGNVSLAKMKLKRLESNVQPIEEMLTEVEKATLQAKTLTQQLLTFAKGGTPILKTASISELIKETAGFALRGSNVRCEYIMPEDLWLVYIDEGQINQVIHNLIVNADHAMPNGGVLSISCANIELQAKDKTPINEGRYVKIEIRDNGIGIAKRHIKRVFDPYFTTKQKGSGLGLTTAHSIIVKHGGHIFVSSELGVGTVFEIYLKATESKTARKNLPKDANLPNHGGKVLVMDDQEMLRKVFSEMLSHIGYEVACAKDGEEAINIYKNAKEENEPFDVVIMDLTVPGGLGGREATRELLRYDPEVRAVVSSGYSKEKVMANYKKYGFKGMISKPFSIEELERVLSNVISLKR